MAQLLFTDIEAWRFQAFATDTTTGQLAHMLGRHCAHAHVKDRIRCGQETGLGSGSASQESEREVVAGASRGVSA